MPEKAEDWGLSPQDAARVKKLVQADEELMLVVKPRTRPGIFTYFNMLPGAVLVGFLVGVVQQFAALDWVAALITAPFWLIGIAALSSPLRHWWRLKHTLYLLTNRCAFVVEPRWVFAEKIRAFPLHPNPVKQVEATPAGHGNIVFAHEYRWQFGGRSICYAPSPVGFLAVPQVERVAQMIAEQAAAVVPTGQPVGPPAVPPPAPAGRISLDGGGWDTRPADTMSSQALIGFGAVLCIFSAIALVVGLFLLRSDRQFDASCVKTQGTVVNVRQETEVSHTRSPQRGAGISIQVNESSAGATSTTYYPTLSFTDAAGRSHFYESDAGSSKLGYYTVGQQLPLRYLPDEPTQVRLGEKSDFGILFTVISSLALMISGSLLAGGIVMRKK